MITKELIETAIEAFCEDNSAGRHGQDMFVGYMEQGEYDLNRVSSDYLAEYILKMVTGDPRMITGISLIAEERARQIEVEGWTAEHDDENLHQELACAAAAYALPTVVNRFDGDEWYTERGDLWPYAWDFTWFKPSPNDRIRELKKAGGLIAAEIDRLLRIEKRKQNEQNQP